MRKIILFSMFSFRLISAYAQYIEVPETGDKLKINVGTSVGVTTNHAVPFWLRSNQFGSIPSEGPALSLFANLYKGYSIENKKVVDWGIGIDLRGNVGRQSQLQIVEGYLKGKLGFLQLKAGRSRDQDGLVDSTLSTGSFSLSGNALGVPKVELSVPEFTPLPIFNNVLSFKGSFSYGWMGVVPIQYGGNYGALVPTKFHHFSTTVMLGRESWRLKLYGGINHDVTWGGDKLIFGDQYRISDLHALFYVVTGKKYMGAKDISKIGNHLGSLDLAADYKFSKFKLTLYHQFFYDKGALVYLANIRDGITGISYTNTEKPSGSLDFKKFLLEFFYSKDQAGQVGAKFTPSGPEYYYNHGVYTEGYSYKDVGLGTPLITPMHFAKDGLASSPINYFINNRVIALNIGVVGKFQSWDWIVKNTISRNFGEFRTSGPDQQWFNGHRVTIKFTDGLFSPVTQYSFYGDFSHPLKKNISVGFTLAADYGGLLNNSVAAAITLSKRLY